MIAIRCGDIISHGTPEEVITQKVLRETFQIDAVIMKEPKTGRPTCVSYDLIPEIINECDDCEDACR